MDHEPDGRQRTNSGRRRTIEPLGLKRDQVGGSGSEAFGITPRFFSAEMIGSAGPPTSKIQGLGHIASLDWGTPSLPAPGWVSQSPLSLTVRVRRIEWSRWSCAREGTRIRDFFPGHHGPSPRSAVSPVVQPAAGAVDGFVEAAAIALFTATDVTMKRGLAAPCVHSALPMTR